jgi:Mn-dependent DtxR family transcriptional regulator
MIIQEAAEMYLETILVIQKRKGEVRSIDIVNEMGYSKPTVSEQMKKFRENGYIEMEADGHITLTEEGRAIAEQTLERHNVIAKIFMGLGVDSETAYQDACRVEHYISQKTYDCMKKHFEIN